MQLSNVRNPIFTRCNDSASVHAHDAEIEFQYSHPRKTSNDYETSTKYSICLNHHHVSKYLILGDSRILGGLHRRPISLRVNRVVSLIRVTNIEYIARTSHTSLSVFSDWANWVSLRCLTPETEIMHGQ